MAQEIIAVNIFVQSCRTSIVRTICLCLSVPPFLPLSRSLSLSVVFSFFCVLSLCLRSWMHTENRTKSDETQSFSPHSFSLSLSLSLFSLFNKSTSTSSIFLVFILPLGYKRRCLPIQSSFPFSNSLHPGQDRTLLLTLFSFNDISFFFLLLRSIFSCLYVGDTTNPRWASQVKRMPQFQVKSDLTRVDLTSEDFSKTLT